jgi:hypothetical protein
MRDMLCPFLLEWNLMFKNLPNGVWLRKWLLHMLRQLYVVLRCLCAKLSTGHVQLYQSMRIVPSSLQNMFPTTRQLRLMHWWLPLELSSQDLRAHCELPSGTKLGRKCMRLYLPTQLLLLKFSMPNKLMPWRLPCWW